MPKSTSQTAKNDLKNTLDDRILHPWQYLEYRGEDDRTFIDKSEGIYLYDKTGKKLIDGPAVIDCLGWSFHHDVGKVPDNEGESGLSMAGDDICSTRID